MYAILLNGPPRSGKDTMAKMLQQIIQRDGNGKIAQIESISLPMRHALFAILRQPYDNETYEAIKDVHNPLIGCTPRKWMIDFSEEFMKPFYGHDFWMQSLITSLHSKPMNVLIVSDCGFPREVEAIVRAFGNQNVLVVNVERPGCSFRGDSRKYVEGNPWTMRAVNNYGLYKLAQNCQVLLAEVADTMKWKI